MRCQSSSRSRERVDLVEPFLHTVFAEVTLAGGGRLADASDAECLGNGDELDVCGISVGALRRRTQAAAHGVELSGNDRARRHCYLIIASIALAVSAYCPVGASFRYSVNGFFASGSLPSFTSAMP